MLLCENAIAIGMFVVASDYEYDRVCHPMHTEGDVDDLALSTPLTSASVRIHLSLCAHLPCDLLNLLSCFVFLTIDHLCVNDIFITFSFVVSLAFCGILCSPHKPCRSLHTSSVIQKESHDHPT